MEGGGGGEGGEGGGGEEGRGGQSPSLHHLAASEASQDTEELLVTSAEWEGGERGERGVASQGELESPHLTTRKATWSQGIVHTPPWSPPVYTVYTIRTPLN